MFLDSPKASTHGLSIEPSRALLLRKKVLRWYEDNKRDLPWRKSKDPYAVWISEVMLQQTRVSTVIPYYEKFLKRWPTISDLAKASDDDVRAAWSGLGYYRRARLMLNAARAVVQEHNGTLPKEAQALRTLPGFGRYTAGAVASIAHDAQSAAVDGNVGRVLARLECIEGAVTSTPNTKKIWAAAEQLAQGPHTGDLNQGLIELGALLCSPRSPDCPRCPLRDHCEARKAQKLDKIPPPKVRAARKVVELTAFVLLHKEQILLEKQDENGLFGGLWCLPQVEGQPELAQAKAEVQKKYGFSPQKVEHVGELKHVLTHRDLMMRLLRVQGTPKVRAPVALHSLESLQNLGLPSYTTRALKAGLPTAALRKTELPGRAKPQLSLKL